MRNKENVIQWAADKGILKQENSLKQFCKVVEEVSEVGSALCKSDRDALIDGIGDSVVTLIILAAQNDLDIENCLEVAYNVIKNRNGKTINGVFIKSEDLK